MNHIELKAELFTASSKVVTEIEDHTVYLVAVIVIDGLPIVDFCTYATWVSQLQESTAKSGNFFILTCWCGVPECAGIYQPISVIHGQKVIRWKMREPKQQEYSFDTRHYQQAVKEGIHHIRRDIADLKIPDMPDESLSIVPGLPNDLDILEIRQRRPGQKRKHQHPMRTERQEAFRRM